MTSMTITMKYHVRIIVCIFPRVYIKNLTVNVYKQNYVYYISLTYNAMRRYARKN